MPRAASRRKLKTEALRGIAGVVELVELSQVRVDWQADAYQGSLTGLTYQQELASASWTFSKDGPSLLALIAFELDAHGTRETPSGSDAKSGFRARCAWRLRYHLHERPQATPAEVGDFVFANGQINVYPYWRARVQELTAQAGWPPLLLPVFRVPSHRPTDVVNQIRPGASRLKASATTRRQLVKSKK